MYGRMNAGTGVTFNGLGVAMEGPDSGAESTAGVRQSSTWRAQDFRRCARGKHRVRGVSALARLQRQWDCERLCLQQAVTDHWCSGVLEELHLEEVWCGQVQRCTVVSAYRQQRLGGISSRPV